MHNDTATILIVDDHQENLLLLTSLLKKQGYQVRQAITAALALKTIRKYPPDLILLDIMLPDMDGYAVCEQVKADERTHEIPVLFLSALTDTEDKLKAFDAGGVDYLTKPFQEREVLARVKTHVALRNSRKHLEREIVERTRVEDALRESEKTYRDLVENIHDILYQTDADGVIEYISPAITVLFGYQPAAMVGQRFTQFLDEADVAIYAERFTIARSGFSGSVELRIVTAALDSKWIRFSYYPTLADGQFGGIHGVITDITERKQAADALIVSEVKYRTLFESMSQGVVYQNADGFITSANPSAERILGLSSDQMMGRTSLDPRWLAIHEDGSDFPGETHPGSVAKRTGKSVHNVIMGVFHPGKGSYTWISIDAVPQFNKGKKEPYQVYATFTDITERKLAEEKLRNEKHFVENLIETAQVIILVLDPQGRIVHFNPYMEAISGYGLEEVQNKDWFSTFLPECDRDGMRELFLHAINDIKTQGNVNPIISKDGVKIEIEWYDKTLKNIDGHVTGLLSIGQDVTERKSSEEELKKHRENLEGLVQERTGELHVMNDKLAAVNDELHQKMRELNTAKEAALEAQRRAEAAQRASEAAQRASEAAQRASEVANRSKSEFLANMSHDIRTPMNAILGFSKILQEQMTEFPQYHDYLEGIQRSGHNLLRLIDDILDLSRIEAGHLEIQPEIVNLRRLISELQYTFFLKAREKGIRLRLHIAPGTPDAVILDGTRLRQILFNLIGNAVKFTKKGAVTLRILDSGFEISDLREPQTNRSPQQSKIANLKFEIQDTGMGIPQDEQERIFKPFQQQIGQQNATFGGAGLGLTITKHLVELMNGSMSVESVVNEGSVFTVLFSEVTIATPEEAVATVAETDVSTMQFTGSRILLVDDNASNRAIIRGYLATYNLRLIEAENGQEALDSLKHMHPDVILMDIRMPVMDGYTAAQEIRNSKPEIRDIPIIAFTAYAMREQRQKYQDIYDAYLSKPTSKRDLILTLTEFLPHTKKDTTSSPPAPEGKTDQTPARSEIAGILEDMQNFAAQTEAFPPALLTRLRDEFLPQQAELCEFMTIDDVIHFAEAVITVGKSFRITPLTTYGETLLRRIHVFNIPKVENLLTLFPEIVTIMIAKTKQPPIKNL